MGVPAESALDSMAAHRPEARYHVLDDAGQDVPVVGAAVGEGRAVVEDVLAFARAHLDLGLERVDSIPQLQHIGFECGQVDPGVDAAEIGC